MQKGVHIRKVSLGDNASLARMIREVFEEYDAPREGTVYTDPTTDDLFSLFRRAGSVLWVAEWNGRPVGCCGIYPTPGLDQDYAELVKFYLAAPFRAMGIGKALLEHSLDSAREMAYTHIYIESMPEFSKALGIYEHLGFKSLPGPLGKSGHTGCPIWMLKEL